jgi:two-component system nitrogen regulation sensor histidine kinase NtrY
MTLFFSWMGILSSSLIVYCVLLWRKNRMGSRFKAKLTILFLLFVLVPVIPLTLFIASLMTRSADVLLLPGIGEALDSSLVTIRVQLEEKGKHFIAAYPDQETWSPQMLKKEGVCSVALFRIQKDGFSAQKFVSSPECLLPGGWKPPHDLAAEADSSGYSSILQGSDAGQMIFVCRRLDASRMIAAGYPVPGLVLRSKERIGRALDVYNTLSLLKESILRKNMIWAFAVLLILGLAFLSINLSKKLSRGISEPIERLVEGMKRIASGDFNVTVQAKGRDEFRFLVDSFNTMTVDLKLTREKLIHAEKVAAWQEVAKRISHEIKNCLTPMAISMKRLRRQAETGFGSSESGELLKNLEEDMDSLRRMSAEFAEFARLPQPDKTLIQLNDIVQSTVRMAESTYGGMSFQLDLTPDPPAIDADPEQIRRVLNNLLKNSVEASGKMQVVRVSTRFEEAPRPAVRLEIVDHGDGMKPETLKRLFTPYFTTKKNGTGLGLAIAEKIVKDHDGDIEVESEPGKGTRITIRFPA